MLLGVKWPSPPSRFVVFANRAKSWKIDADSISSVLRQPVPAARPGWFIPSLRPQVELILQLLTLTIWQFVAKTPSGAK
jgi:hypothetical protein